jgi:hypothetical protein
MSAPDMTQFSNQIIAVGALGTAAYGLVDATKAFRGGISNRGFSFIETALTPFGDALDEALGRNPGCEWQKVMKSHWVSGRAKDEQKAIAVSLIQLGLTATNAPAIATAAQVSPEELGKIVVALEKGQELTAEQLNVLGRFKATIEARIDAAYDRAEEVYRNSARFAAGMVSVLLAVAATYIFYPDGADPRHYQIAILIGLVAVPLAPIAKDLASALSTAAAALGRRVSP